MKNFVLYIGLISMTCSALHQQFDCIDKKRKLRCVLHENCPNNRIVLTKTCPSDRICCRKYKPNPYLPLRVVPEENLPTTTEPSILIKNRYRVEEDLDDERLIFPSEMDELKYITVVTPSPGSSNSDEDEVMFNRESKSKNDKNFKFPLEKLEKRKSIQACHRYAEVSMEYLHFMPLLPEVSPKKFAVDKCDPQINPLIVGGKNATIKDFPHMAALGYNKSNDIIDYLCGGTLISENFVLTAGHCANTRWGPPVVAHLGSAELFSQEATRVSIIDVITHPKYKPPSCYHDLALLKLENSVKLTMNLRPACLPTTFSEEKAENKIVVATGWGKTGFGRESSSTLLKVALKVVKTEDCGKYYEADTKTEALKLGITSNMICAAGYRDVEHDTCQGDSGGPLQAPLEQYECMSQVLAITSFGKSCGAGIPAVYTRVLSYIDWIEDIVW